MFQVVSSYTNIAMYLIILNKFNQIALNIVHGVEKNEQNSFDHIPTTPPVHLMAFEM